MKKVILAGILLCGVVLFQAYAQCTRTHYLCSAQFSKEEKSASWNYNNQSRSGSFEKGKKYEMSFIAYEGFEYRVSTCSDVEGSESVEFELSKDVVVRVKDSDGNTNIKKQREVVYNNKDEGNAPYVLFTTDKTKKFFLSVHVPSTGSSANKKLTNTDFACVGVFIEHRKLEKTGFGF